MHARTVTTILIAIGVCFTAANVAGTSHGQPNLEPAPGGRPCCADLSARYEQAFRAVGVVAPGETVEVLTAPPDGPLYITGIYVSNDVDTRMFIDDELVLLHAGGLSGITNPWVGAVGAPIVVQPAQVVSFENFAGGRTTTITITGYDFGPPHAVRP
jgi:hypothetical protein